VNPQQSPTSLNVSAALHDEEERARYFQATFLAALVLVKIFGAYLPIFFVHFIVIALLANMLVLC
jgi:hypothetical protein